MHRLATIGLVAAFLFVQICCAAPLRAAVFEAKEPMHCPISKGDCEAGKPKQCSGGPQLVSEVAQKRHSVFPLLIELPADTLVRTVDLPPIDVANIWSTTTPTIQLRI